MFDIHEYKEAYDAMKLSDGFKTGLVQKMREKAGTNSPRRRLVIAAVTSVLLLSTAGVFGANHATGGRLLGGLFNNDKTNATETTAKPTETVKETEPTKATEKEVVITEATEAKETKIEETEPKVTETEATQKPTPKPTQSSRKPAVTVSVEGDYVVVRWQKITDSDLCGYKVVASETNPNPMYSADGYYKYITDRNVTECKIKSGDLYKSGGFSRFSGGTSYYFSVTALYSDERIAGNAKMVKMPGDPAPEPTYPAVTVSVTQTEAGALLVTWNATEDPTDFKYYKVVASIGNPNPAYPGDGYAAVFSNKNTVSYLIEPGVGYKGGGDVGTFVAGQWYYISVTACYDGCNKAGNAIYIQMPEAETEPSVVER